MQFLEIFFRFIKGEKMKRLFPLLAFIASLFYISCSFYSNCSNVKVSIDRQVLSDSFGFSANGGNERFCTESYVKIIIKNGSYLKSFKFPFDREKLNSSESDDVSFNISNIPCGDSDITMLICSDFTENIFSIEQFVSLRGNAEAYITNGENDVELVLESVPSYMLHVSDFSTVFTQDSLINAESSNEYFSWNVSGSSFYFDVNSAVKGSALVSYLNDNCIELVPSTRKMIANGTIGAMCGDFYYYDDSFNPNYDSNKTVIGIVFETDSSGYPLKIVNISQASNVALSSNAAQGASSKIDTSDTDGSVNFNAFKSTVADISGNDYASKYPAFYYANGLKDGGKSWYIPSKEELIFLMSQSVIINNALSRVESSVNINTSSVYWSSSQYKDNDEFKTHAWYYDFMSANVSKQSKTAQCVVRTIAKVR